MPETGLFGQQLLAKLLPGSQTKADVRGFAKTSENMVAERLDGRQLLIGKKGGRC
jgi:hypothetical protein